MCKNFIYISTRIKLSNWIISPNKGEHTKYLSCHHLGFIITKATRKKMKPVSPVLCLALLSTTVHLACWLDLMPGGTKNVKKQWTKIWTQISNIKNTSPRVIQRPKSDRNCTLDIYRETNINFDLTKYATPRFCQLNAFAVLCLLMSGALFSVTFAFISCQFMSVSCVYLLIYSVLSFSSLSFPCFFASAPEDAKRNNFTSFHSIPIFSCCIHLMRSPTPWPYFLAHATRHVTEAKHQALSLA